MARVAGVASVQDLCAVLKKSQLLSSEQLDAAQKLAAEGGDPKAVARRWVRGGLLTAWQAGQIIGGRTNLHVGKYRLVDQLGSVGLGRVYLAQHVTMNRRVALKVLAKRYSDPESIDRFLAQVRQLAALDHRNVIQVYDVDQADERYFLVMEYMEGCDLQKQVQKSGALSPREAADLIRQAAAGLAYAHAQGQFHGSVRPANLLFDASGNLKLLNLGLAQLAHPDAGSLDGDSETEADAVIFARPGQDADAEATEAADLYGLGGTLWYALTGEGALPSGKEAHSPERIAAALRKRRPEAPPELATLCGQIVCASAGFRTASQIEQALAKWLATQPASAPAAAAASNAAETPAVPRAAPRAAPAAARKLATAAALEKPTAPPAADSGGDAPSFSFNLNVGGTKPPAANLPPALAAAAPAGPAVSAAAPPPAAGVAAGTVAGLPLPLVLGLGGGGLALTLLLAVGLYFVLNRGEPQVATGPDNGTPTASPAPAKNAPPGAAKRTGANDPDADPNATTLPPPGGGEPGEKPAEPMPMAPAPAEPAPAEPQPEPPPAEPAPAEPAPAEPAPSEPAPMAEPKPAEPPPAEPKPTEPAVKPLATFPAIVELPLAGKPTAGGSATDPVKLGEIVVVPADLAIVNLIGGDKAIPSKGKLTFTLAAGNNGLADRDWEIRLVGGKMDESGRNDGVLVAKLFHRENQLFFQWTEEALTDDNCNYLRNCVLHLKFGGDEKHVALRHSVTFDAYAINLEKAAAGRVDIKLDYLPDPEALKLEVLPIEGLNDQRVEEKEGTLEKTTRLVVLGQGETETLMFKLDVLTTKKMMTIAVAPHFKVATAPEWQRMLPTTLKRTQAQTVGLNSQLLAASQQFEKQPAAEKQKQGAVKAQIEQQMNTTQLAIRQFDTLKAFHDALTGKAYLHFKLHYTVGDQTVVLAESVVPEEPAGRGPKRPMPEPMEVPKLDLGSDQ